MGDEGVVGLLRHHLVDRAGRAADGAQRRFEAARRHRGVGIELHQALLRRGVADFLDVIHRMAEREVSSSASGACSRTSVVEFLSAEHALDRADAIGPLGMAGPLGD